jgi:type I restriction enzyme M protein
VARRHEHRAGDWQSVASRLDEIICAHSGEDPFEESLKLLVAKLAHEASGAPVGSFLQGVDAAEAQVEVGSLVAKAGETWPGILEPGQECRLTGVELLKCAEVLRSERLLVDELVGLDTIFEFIVGKASKGQKGQYFTPRHVVAEVVRMACPQPGESLVDPACGSGAFLHHSLSAEPKCLVHGFDQDSRAIRVARVMLAAAGQPVSRVFRTDSLVRPAQGLWSEDTPGIEDYLHASEPKHKGFDLVLTNPPFAGDVGAKFAGSYELSQGGRVERDVLFLERCVELLRPGGRLAIVLPHNKLAGKRWAYVRKWLLLRVKVAGVLGLGRNTFMPHTSQKACVLFAVKRRKTLTRVPRNEEVVFFVSEREGKDARGRLVLLESGTVDHDLHEATSRIQAALGVSEVLCG